MLKLNETYFGFTDNKKPMQAAKIEKSLDMLYRYDGIVMSQKEFIYKKLQEGYILDIVENYSYYSEKLKSYTKPRTLYKLVDPVDGSYYEINKTLYEYAAYLLENKFLDTEKAITYIRQEKINKKEQERLERERIERERQEREMQRQKEEEERKQQYRIKQEYWRKQGENLLNSLGYNPITETLDKYWQEIESIYKGREIDKETEYKKAITKFTELLGNESYCNYWIKSFVKYENDKELNFITLDKNISKFLEKEILFKVFNISLDDQPRTISAKIKAVYNNRQYKGGQPIKEHEFYIFDNKTKQFEKRIGQKIKIEHITCFVHEENGVYKVTEAKTGLMLSSPAKTKKESLERAKTNVKKAIDRIDQIIQNAINQNGISPLYQNETVTV